MKEERRREESNILLVREDVSLVESLWLPTLEVMGLKDVDTNKVTTEMGGLSINRNKTLSLDRK